MRIVYPYFVVVALAHSSTPLDSRQSCHSERHDWRERL